MQREDERVLLRCFRRLGCVPLKTHPAGPRLEHPLRRDVPHHGRGPARSPAIATSRLRGTRAVYLADGSVFPWLPPKGLTFNIMANADRVGAIVAERLR